MPKRAAHKSSVQAHHPTATPSAFHAAEETPQYIQSNESTIGPGTSENNVEPLSPKESPLLSRFEQAALLEPPSTKRAGPVVLVQDSADEADVHVDDIIRSTTTMDGGWFELSCIDSCYATESSVSRVYQTNSDASVLIDNQVISASEDEGLFEQPFQWSKEYDDSILLSDSSSTSATELLFSHSEMSDGLEKIAEPPVAQETVEPRPSIIRSYPLRERTFQQRQPYTADKEWHARLIGSRKASRRSPSRDYLPDDVMLGELQDDEEDPDYEEHSSLAVDDTTIMAGDSLPRRPRPSRQPEVLDFSFHDLDDDDLPTIYELRRQFSIRSQASDTADEPKSRNIPQASPALRLMSALSARAKRKLVRLATQQVEPLESLETEPSMIPWTHDPSPSPRRPSSEDADDNMTQLQSNGGGLTLGASSNSNHRRHIQVSSSDDDEDKVLLAKTKKHKHRQHVLPTAFFKKNMLPDDASALKALRSKLKHSNAPESVARSESDHIQHAHHAKRRIDLSRRGDGYLDDFIAQLAQDKSDSEDEAQSSQQENSDGIEYFGTSPRPTPHDTILADSRKSLPKSYKRLNRRISESNDTGSSDLDRHTSISEHDLDFGWPGSGVERPSPASKKRRRSSGNHPSIKKRRPTHRKPRYIRTDAGSEKTNPDSARLDSSQGDFYGYWTKRHHEENGSDHNNDHNYDYDYDYDYDHDYNHDYDHDWPDHDDEPVVRNLARDNSLPTPRGQKPRRRKEDLGYPIRRYNTTEPRHQQRKISRATVVRNKPRPTFTRRSAVHQGPKLGQTGQQKLPAMRQRTLYSHFSSWYPQFPAPSRPQFVHKPVFKPVTSRAGIQPIPNRHLEIARGKAMKETGGYNDSEFVSDDYYAQDQDWESEAGFVASQAPSTGHGTLPPAPIVITQKAQDSKPTSFARQRKPNDIQEFSESDLRGSTTSNGVYFSRDTYIGRGILSRVLRAMSPQASEASNAQEHVSQVVFFGQLFAQDRHDIPAVQHALEGVILDFESRFRSIEETQSIHDPGYFRLGSLEHAQSEFTACLLALENMTILLIEYSTCAHHDFASFWTMFKTVAVDVLARLAEALPTARHHSMTSRLVLWTTWALLTWEILYDCIAQQDQQQRQQLGQQQEQQLEHQHEHQQEHQQELQQGQRQEKQQEQQQEQRKHNHIDGPIMKLFKQLLEVADASFLSRLLKSLNPPQASGAISGQDDLEIWVCLIQVLDQYAHLRDSSRSFWVYFNRQVLETWIAVNETPGDMIWLEQESHVWMLLQGMCMLHQFGKEGSSNTEIRTRDNWELISWILRKNWLERTPPDSYTTERQLRKLLIFCHSRIQTWNWTPCADIVSQIYRYFSKRNFRDMSSEPGYRLPEFLKHMIATPVKDSIQPEERLVDFPGTSGFQLDVSYTKTVDLEHDRCFEIFLKIATRAIRWQVCEIGGNKQDVEVLSTPTTTTVPQSDSMDESQSRVGKIRTCKRLLSSISPTIVFTISADGSSEQTYSSLCNTCNLVLVLALLVPDYIRLSTIGELRSLLNFDESDDASRKILLEAVFYLGVVWQRQVGWGHGIGQDGRSPEKVVDYLFGRLEFMCQIFEKDMNIMHAGSSHAHMKRKPPLNALIETTLGYIARLMTYARNMEIDRIPYPPLVFLDQSTLSFMLLLLY
ncbi:hypothetical protein BGX31_009371 [Mortierella sp. GBA43]|nr:hypothetical protein BGX31_009371 [Mortierella sp. GBA43]